MWVENRFKASWKQVGRKLEVSWTLVWSESEASWKCFGSKMEASRKQVRSKLEVSWKQLERDLLACTYYQVVRKVQWISIEKVFLLFYYLFALILFKKAAFLQSFMSKNYWFYRSQGIISKAFGLMGIIISQKNFPTFLSYCISHVDCTFFSSIFLVVAWRADTRNVWSQKSLCQVMKLQKKLDDLYFCWYILSWCLLHQTSACAYVQCMFRVHIVSEDAFKVQYWTLFHDLFMTLFGQQTFFVNVLHLQGNLSVFQVERKQLTLHK